MKIPSKEELEELYSINSMSQMGKILGVSNVTVKNWLNRLGIETRKHSDNQKLFSTNIKECPENFLDIYAIHKTIEATALALDVSYPTIRKWLENYNVQPQGKKIDLDKNIFIDEYKNKTQKELATFFNVSRKKISATIDEFGLNKRTASNAAKIAVKNGIDTKKEKYGYSYFKPGVKQSIGELEIKSFLNDVLGFNFQSNREILSNGKELDLFDSDCGLAIEFCGLYWHSEARQQNNNYHRQKFLECQEHNIELITIYDLEWKKKPEQIKKFLSARLGKFGRRIYARDCKFQKIDNVRIFLDNNHIQGSAQIITASYGLHYDKELVGVVTDGPHHRNKDVLVLNRLAFLDDYQIVGGASKLLKNSLKDFGEVITWSDNRWSTGKLYEKSGFVLDENLYSDYSYTNGWSIKSKQSMRKSATDCPPEITEVEWNKSNGWWRIWDCGRRWKWEA